MPQTIEIWKGPFCALKLILGLIVCSLALLRPLLARPPMAAPEETGSDGRRLAMVAASISDRSHQPELYSFTPEQGAAGAQVEIRGASLQETLEVYINETPAAFHVSSDSSLLATIPDLANSGAIRIVTPEGEVRSADEFVVVSPPQIRSFVPNEGPEGTLVEIAGRNFVDVQDVSFDGRSASIFEVKNDTLIVARVPTEASSGQIRVSNLAGEATTFRIFNIIEDPLITVVSPIRGEVSSTVHLTGYGFEGARSVLFSGDVEASFAVRSNTEIEVVVPEDAVSGSIQVVTADAEMLTTPSDFVVTYPRIEPGMNLCRLSAASVTQSSLAFPFAVADKACDGHTAGAFDDRSISATQIELGAWWEADLGGIYPLSEIVIWNREDCCQHELANFFVFVSDYPFIAESLIDARADQRIEAFLIDEVEDKESLVVDRSARYIRLQLAGIGELNLAEVELRFGGETTPSNTANETPDESGAIELSPAFPSPFRDRTTISFALSAHGHTRLSVFDALGREVVVLVDEYRLAGLHTAVLEAGHLPAGVYFYRLQQDSRVLTGSLVRQ